MERRQFLSKSAAMLVGMSFWDGNGQAFAGTATPNPASATGPFTQPKLPYALNALAPFLSEEQMNFHYNKHHASYFKNLNGLVAGKPEAKMNLRDLVMKAPAGPMFNNAAQAWNHTFFWESMAPSGGGEPKGALATAIQSSFGSVSNFQKEFTDKATKLFGSGWAWLATDKNGKLEIMDLGNADNPLKHEREPILTLDVWEHSYYIDYRNERAKYAQDFWKKVNWTFAQNNYQKALKHPS